MRLIWTTENIDHVRQYCSLLTKHKIPFLCEEQTEKNWGSDQYGQKKLLIWIHDEDDVIKSQELLEEFLKDPNHPDMALPNAYEEPVRPSPITNYVERKINHSLRGPESELPTESSTPIRLTTFLVLICSFVFLFELYGQRNQDSISAPIQEKLLTTSPITRTLLFDYPRSYELLDKIAALYGYESLAKPQELPNPGKFLFDEYQKEPIWKGIYPYLVSWTKEAWTKKAVQMPKLDQMKLFEKEKEGEYWRIITPIFLHNDILHLFFNMIWLLLLGTQIELKIGSWRSIVFIVIVAAISNSSQYLMTGPLFIGFSGIICGQAFFIRARQRLAPWEGYQMTSATFTFICFFIGTMALFSFATFILEVCDNNFLHIGIANMAHLVGAATGYLLGNMRYFSERI
jgi:GlpG protein